MLGLNRERAASPPQGCAPRSSSTTAQHRFDLLPDLLPELSDTSPNAKSSPKSLSPLQRRAPSSSDHHQPFVSRSQSSASLATSEARLGALSVSPSPPSYGRASLSPEKDSTDLGSGGNKNRHQLLKSLAPRSGMIPTPMKLRSGSRTVRRRKARPRLDSTRFQSLIVKRIKQCFQLEPGF